LYKFGTKESFNPDERNMMQSRYETKLNLVLGMIAEKAKRGDSVIGIGCAQGNCTFPTKIIRKIETLMLYIPAITPKLAADLVCIAVTPTHFYEHVWHINWINEG